jgi:hypothetical protein
MSAVGITPKLIIPAAAHQIAGEDKKVSAGELKTAGITGEHAKKALSNKYDTDKNGLDPHELAKYLSSRAGSYTIRVNGRSYRINNGKLEQLKDKSASPAKTGEKKTDQPIYDPYSMGRAHENLNAVSNRNIPRAAFTAFYTKWFGKDGKKSVDIHDSDFNEDWAALLGHDEDDFRWQGGDAFLGNQDGTKRGDVINGRQFAKRVLFGRAKMAVRRGITGWSLEGLLTSSKVVLVDMKVGYRIFLEEILPRLLNSHRSVLRRLWDKQYLTVAGQVWIKMGGSEKEKGNRRKLFTDIDRELRKYCDKRNPRKGWSILKDLQSEKYRGLRELLFVAYLSAFDKAVYLQSKPKVEVKISGPIGAERSEQFMLGVLADSVLGVRVALPEELDKDSIKSRANRANRPLPPKLKKPKLTAAPKKPKV